MQTGTAWSLLSYLDALSFFALPSVLARTVDILARRCGSGQPCPAPALPGSVFNFATFGLMLAAGFSYIALMMSEYMEHTAVFLHSVGAASHMF